jgi:hypothetical protein
MPSMNVRKVTSEQEPEYPSREQFRHLRHLFGATVLGAGMALSACQSRTAGVPVPTPRTPGEPAVVPGHTSSTKQAPSGNQASPSPQPDDPPPGRTLGKIKAEPSRLDPPPRLMGDVAVMPKPGALPPESPKNE